MASVYKATYTKPGPQGTRIKKRSRLYTIEYTDAHGVRRKISSKTADKKAALFLSNELEKQAARGRVGALDPFEAGKKTPLAAHLEAYEAYHRQQETADRHRKQVLARLRSAFSAIRATFPSDVTVPRVEKYLGKLQAEGRGARTRNSHLSSLKAFFTWCVRTQRLEANPLSSILSVKESEDKRRIRRALTGAEVSKLLRAAAERPVHERKNQKIRKATRKQLREARRSGRQRALTYKLLFETGLRVGELRQLLWGDLDLEGEVASLQVRASVAKNRKATTLPLRAELVTDLLAWKGINPSAKAGDKVLHIAWRPVDLLKKDLAFAGLPYQDEEGRYADLHALRHSLASHLATSGVPPRVSQSLLRHSSIDLTMQTYTDSTFLDRAAAQVQLPSLPPLFGEEPLPAAQAAG